jgi:hypothetical protein
MQYEAMRDVFSQRECQEAATEWNNDNGGSGSRDGQRNDSKGGRENKFAGAALAWGLLPIDHREDRTGEIGRGIHQPVCAGSFKFVSGTITLEHAKTAHSERMGAGNIISAIPNHQTVRRRKTMFRQNMGEQFRLVIQLAARH